ncbi:MULTISPECIES: neutral zinc metallopeptidase [unclassified Psychrobacter]|uniref:KPN_02809 family neutral zinc metallopeptidase n=1 Tax=unclassified Psychrobacter TaxID=196806 RepID=UPI0025B4635C|nr:MULTISPECIES: neutral zinc metallopeptidase [unclassified Psychrobacter]MDN3454324.1 neutral zinc metallopeptidase [Psychrobacter sp. APC 3350]MDN3503585.1 neutral zinc metallopeptidase [Psychrobacter sp. 5A.1]
MKWQGRRGSSNVRSSTGGGKMIGGGIGGIIIAGILWLVFGVNPMTALQTGQAVTGGGKSTSTAPTTNTDRDTQFVKVVLADTEEVWHQIFNEAGSTYKEPSLILFNGQVSSACGSASSATGPFYCPGDQTIYLDTSFFVEMRQNLGISGDQQGSGGEENQGKAGDFAQAYVISHEVGHHVQTLLGISQQVNEARQQVTQAESNKLSVLQELQADCFAGVWAQRNQQRVQFLEAGDIDEAVNAAGQIGDDRLAKASGGAVVPDNFTHGTSQQRVEWFTRGLESGSVQSCDTFSGAL